MFAAAIDDSPARRRALASQLAGLYGVTPDLATTADLAALVEAARAEAAVADGGDYIAFGSFFAWGVKSLARRASVSLLTRARGLGVRVVAIGGSAA